jgi:hypothetical protein
MAELLVERPRVGGGLRFPRPSLALHDERVQDRLVQREGIRAAWPSGHRKSFNENLAPLRRFLASSVGRPWSDVHAEICAHVRPASTVQQHILLHLQWYVQTHVVERDGVLFHGAGYEYGRPLIGYRYHQFYVCPRTGRLQQVAHIPRHRKPDPRPFVLLGRDRLAHQIDGFWYAIRLAPVPQEGGVWDVLLCRVVYSADARILAERYGTASYAHTKSQLSRRGVQREVLPALSRVAGAAAKGH